MFEYFQWVDVHFTGSSEGIQEVSLHPASMVDSTGRSMPLSLVPLCAYQGQVLGPDMPGHNFSYCDIFEPDVLEGKLCYSMNLTKLSHGFAETKMGKSQGLILVIDAGDVLKQKTENSLIPTTDIIKQNFGKQNVDISHDIESAKIHIQTLEKIKDSRAGFYALTSLKKITGTGSFLDLPDHQKHCQQETFENCRAKRYFEEVRTRCHCVPWTLGTYTFDQVSVDCSQNFMNSYFRTQPSAPWLRRAVYFQLVKRQRRRMIVWFLALGCMPMSTTPLT